MKLQRKAAMLTRHDDLNSDYLTGTNLLLSDEAMGWAPAWVVAATRQWNKVEDERERTGKKVWPHLECAPGRCEGRKSDGSRCQNWHPGTAASGNMCKFHVGRTEQPQNVLAKSRNRVRSIALEAVQELESLMNSATSEPVRLKAATEILDRAGIRAGFEIDEKVTVEVRPAAAQIQDRLKQLSILSKKMQEEPAEIIEAEVVDHDE